MTIVNVIISNPRDTVFNTLIIFLSLSCSIDLFRKNIGTYRKYDIFFNFRFTENIFPSIMENQEKMIFTLSVFTKMLFFMQCHSST